MTRNLSIAMALFVATASACAGVPSAAQIAHDIESKGARATVASLNHDGQFDAVLAKIASGNATWVNLARPLSQGTDAGDSTGLTIALATALPKHATAVLRALGDGPVTNSTAVCGVPFIEPTTSEVKTYLARAIPAVTRVAEPARLAQRASCLASLQRVKEQSQQPR
ncbi:MAG: hypothetical protein WCA85_09065 [Paraburkholderia sp.]|uniref:hypothetical protein n=1 Tax=Paraburkholderia sp. TaxID=1926495 RepID=UPI003C45594F